MARRNPITNEPEDLCNKCNWYVLVSDFVDTHEYQHEYLTSGKDNFFKIFDIDY